MTLDQFSLFRKK